MVFALGEVYSQRSWSGGWQNILPFDTCSLFNIFRCLVCMKSHRTVFISSEAAAIAFIISCSLGVCANSGTEIRKQSIGSICLIIFFQLFSFSPFSIYFAIR